MRSSTVFSGSSVLAPLGTSCRWWPWRGSLAVWSPRRGLSSRRTGQPVDAQPPPAWTMRIVTMAFVRPFRARSQRPGGRPCAVLVVAASTSTCAGRALGMRRSRTGGRHEAALATGDADGLGRAPGDDPGCDGATDQPPRERLDRSRPRPASGRTGPVGRAAASGRQRAAGQRQHQANASVDAGHRISCRFVSISRPGRSTRRRVRLREGAGGTRRREPSIPGDPSSLGGRKRWTRVQDPASGRDQTSTRPPLRQ